MRGAIGLLCFLGGTVGCQSDPGPALPSAEVGVFFGGQVQRVKRVEVQKVRPPKIGFRIVFPEDALPEHLNSPIDYEVVRPGPAGRRVTKKGTLKLPAGQDRIDHVIALSPTDKLGVWNVRVVQSDTVLADRALYLVEAPTIAP